MIDLLRNAFREISPAKDVEEKNPYRLLLHYRDCYMFIGGSHP
jgi:hypothetical protein